MQGLVGKSEKERPFGRRKCVSKFNVNTQSAKQDFFNKKFTALTTSFAIV
jgi:hypothetical protein